MTTGDRYRELLDEHLKGAVLERMVRYAELLELWSAKHSLVRFAEPRELVDRHLLDALAGVRLLEGRGRLLDVGSGAGLPGVPLLIAKPRWRGVLLEPRQKRWAFLKLVIRELGLDAEAVDRRYENRKMRVLTWSPHARLGAEKRCSLGPDPISPRGDESRCGRRWMASRRSVIRVIGVC